MLSYKSEVVDVGCTTLPGKNVPGEKEREHYRSVCETPRQVFSMWHTLAL